MRGQADILKLLRVASFLWLIYLGISAIIDYALKTPGPVERFLYITDGAIAGFFLVVSLIPPIQKKMGKAFLPIVIVLISALPMVLNQIAVRYIFSSPLPPPEAMLTRVVPFLLIALLFVSWQYKWQYIVTFCVIIALFNVAILWAYVSHDRSAFSGGLFAIMTQVVSFLMVGFFINVIVGWLQHQQRSLEEANTRLTNYAQTLEDLAVTKERSRIAQELHDTLSHTLSGLSVQLETMKAYWDVDPITARKRLDKSLTAIRAGLEETRRILVALRAKPLEELGLVPAVRQLAEDAVGQTGITLNFSAANGMPALSAEEEQCIFRIAQEAITNVVKHSRAKQLTVRLEAKENKAVLTIQDDGTGFEISTTNDGRHFGLLGMKERVGLVKGNLEIISKPGSGTLVRLTI